MDNGLTPQLLIDAEITGVVVPEGYVKDGKIVLNVDTRAVKALELGNEFITFSARFGGTPHAVKLPIQSVLAIVTRENGQGLIFQEEKAEKERQCENSANENEETKPDRIAGTNRRPHLRLVD